jgi:hypothetical protein
MAWVPPGAALSIAIAIRRGLDMRIRPGVAEID